MIKVACLIDDVEVPGKLVKKQKVITQPELDKVSQDLYSIVPGMHGALQEIDRVDGIVFPLLQLEDRFLVAPDAAHDERLKQYIRIIGSLIETSLKPTKKEIQNISAFMTIFEKRQDNIILDLKKRSFALQQDLGGDESEGALEGKDKTAEKKAEEVDFAVAADRLRRLAEPQEAIVERPR